MISAARRRQMSMNRVSLPVRVGRWWFVPAGIVLLIGGNHYLNRQQLPLVAVLALLCFVKAALAAPQLPLLAIGKGPGAGRSECTPRDTDN